MTTATKTMATETDRAPPTLILNLPTTDLSRAQAFYTALSFTYNPAWSDNSSAAFHLPPPKNNISLMIHTPERMKQFARPGATILADVQASNTTESLVTHYVPDA